MTVAEAARPVNRTRGTARAARAGSSASRLRSAEDWHGPQAASTSPNLDEGATIIEAGR